MYLIKVETRKVCCHWREFADASAAVSWFETWREEALSMLALSRGWCAMTVRLTLRGDLLREFVPG